MCPCSLAGHMEKAWVQVAIPSAPIPKFCSWAHINDSERAGCLPSLVRVLDGSLATLWSEKSKDSDLWAQLSNCWFLSCTGSNLYKRHVNIRDVANMQIDTGINLWVFILHFSPIFLLIPIHRQQHVFSVDPSTLFS